MKEKMEKKNEKRKKKNGRFKSQLIYIYFSLVDFRKVVLTGGDGERKGGSNEKQEYTA